MPQFDISSNKNLILPYLLAFFVYIVLVLFFLHSNAKLWGFFTSFFINYNVINNFYLINLFYIDLELENNFVKNNKLNIDFF